MYAKFEEGHELTGNARYEGFCAELAEKLATRLQFGYTLRPVVDGKYGAKMSNGSWNGMVGELMRKVLTNYSHHRLTLRHKTSSLAFLVLHRLLSLCQFACSPVCTEDN